MAGMKCLICNRYSHDIDAHNGNYHSSLGPPTEFVRPGKPTPPAEQPFCPGHMRHWFAARGLPGVALPTCCRCGIPNPKWTPALAERMEEMGYGAEWRTAEGWDAAPTNGSSTHEVAE